MQRAQQQQQQQESGPPSTQALEGGRVWGFSLPWSSDVPCIDEERPTIDPSSGNPSSGEGGHVNVKYMGGSARAVGRHGQMSKTAPDVTGGETPGVTSLVGDCLRLADVSYHEDAALRHAAHVGDVAGARMLVGHGADPCARDGMALALAAGGGHVDMVRFLIDEAGDLLRHVFLGFIGAMATPFHSFCLFKEAP